MVHGNTIPRPTGRYVEADPIGLDGGSFSPYDYVGDNPISNVDPDGLQVAAGVEIGTLLEPGLGTVIGAAIGIGIGAAAVHETCQNHKCPPCKTVSGKIVPVGTIGYGPLDVIPEDVKQHGVYGSHHNLFRANQIPYPNCDCFWQKLKDVAKPEQLQPDWIPVEPFVN